MARHRLAADDKRDVDHTSLDLLARLAKELEARATDALHEERRDLDGNAGVQADVARKVELVEVAGGNAASDDRIDVFRGDAGATQHLACHLDAQVGR